MRARRSAPRPCRPRASVRGPSRAPSRELLRVHEARAHLRESRPRSRRKSRMSRSDTASDNTASLRNSSVSLCAPSPVERWVSATARCSTDEAMPGSPRAPAPPGHATVSASGTASTRRRPHREPRGIRRPISASGPSRCARVVARVGADRPSAGRACSRPHLPSWPANPAAKAFLPRRECPEARSPLPDRRRGDLAVELRGRRAASHRVREHVRIGDRARVDERQRALEGRIVLAGEPGDEVGADRRIREVFADHREPLGGERRVVAAAHAAQHPVVGRLQRHVQVRAGDGALASGGRAAR